MPNSVLTRGRKMVARLTALAMVASIMVIGAAPASAAVVDTSATCPSASIPSAGFTDIAAYSAAQQLAINCLADYEITQGTSATTYSPAMDVSRWQMALFLTRQAEVHGLTLGDGSSQGFTDIAAYPAATQTAINQLAQLDITQGTTATTYSPAAPVSRWQMALFLTRLLDAAGYTLGSGASQGFTDIAAYPATTQTAINQIAQAGVSEGFTATTFGPGQNTSRVQMASFLTRTLAADGIVHAAQNFIVTSWVDMTSYTYSNGTTTVKVTPATGDTYTVDGSAASKAVFFANLSVGDLVNHSGTTHNLTNVATTSYVSGLVGAVPANSYTIVEPVTGDALNTVDYTTGTNTVFTVGGASASQASFEANLSVGDTVVSTGTGANAANTRTIALTNGTVSGSVTDTTGVLVTVGVLDVPDPTVGDSVTIDGVVSDHTTFNTEVTVGDTATYAMAGGVETYTLTNLAPSPVSGPAVANKVALVDTAAADALDTNETVEVVQNGAIVAVTLRNSNGDLDPATNSFSTYRVSGALVTAAEFFAAITVGDTIVTVQADEPAGTSSSISLTNVTGITAKELTVITPGDPSLNIELGDGDDDSEDIDYTATSVAGLSTTGAGTVVYQVNGVASTQGNWETDAAAFITSASITPTVTLSKVGDNLVWNLES